MIGDCHTFNISRTIQSLRFATRCPTAPPTILVRPGPLLSTVRTWRLKSERRVGRSVGGDGAIDVRRLERQRQPRNYSANNGKVNQQRRRPPSHARRYASTAPAPLRLSLPNRLSGSQSHRTQVEERTGGGNREGFGLYMRCADCMQ